MIHLNIRNIVTKVGTNVKRNVISRTYGMDVLEVYDGISEAVKKERLHRLFDLADRISLELNELLVGSSVPVLIDGDSRRDPDHWQGRGEDNRVVNFPKSGREAVGDIVDVHLLRAGPHSLFGERASRDGRLPVIGAA